MTTLTMQFSNESNPEGGGGGLFELGETCCEECSKYAVGLFAEVGDSGLFALCYEHMLAISPLAADALLGRDGEMTPLQLMLVDELGTCPGCGGGLDTGVGFGSRDLECADTCLGEAWQSEDGSEGHSGCDCGGSDEDAHCGWSGSYPLELYREKLMAKFKNGAGGDGQQLVAAVVGGVFGMRIQEKGV